MDRLLKQLQLPIQLIKIVKLGTDYLGNSSIYFNQLLSN